MAASAHPAGARAVMVLGCTSGAGKSWLATALCRLYARRGYRVAPFKAQNMSNHARVVAAGDGEIGSAQYFQALAAGVLPDVRMNPVLLKPEADTRSQVVLLGRVRRELSDQPWRERAALLWSTARQAYLSLRDDYQLIVIEGAGSPAEINLAAVDYVNTGTARLSDAACILVANIDHGGAFAHLYGTHRLMDARVREQLRGFVLNRFRGDAALLAPGPERLRELTGVPTLGIVPTMHEHGLPEEDAVPHDSRSGGPFRVVVIVGPHASNLDEFERLRAADAELAFARDPAAVGRADLLVLPGSKQARADLAWLTGQGFEPIIRQHVAAGRPLLAICGGLQMLGERLEDPDGLEAAAPGDAHGLGLLPLVTRFRRDKRLAAVRSRFGTLSQPWAALSGLEIDGYEIHLGETRVAPAAAGEAMRCVLGHGPADPIGWQRGPILALYAHGVLENSALLAALTGTMPRTPGIDFDAMADHVEQSFVPGSLDSLPGPAP